MKNPFTNKSTTNTPLQPEQQPTPPFSATPSDNEKEKKRRSSSFDEGRVPWVTWRSLTLGAFVSIGGIIFGYDTGQISGFLEMNNYKQRYGQFRNGEWAFSNVRSGLIVSMVSLHIQRALTHLTWLNKRGRLELKKRV
jgi:SP family sugar:H+ symporter-like MFS transporter